MAAKTIEPETVYVATHYSHAVRAGNTLYISGQVPKDADGALVGEGDVAAQAHQAFRNLKAVLEKAGGGVEHIVKYTMFATSLAHKQAIGEVRAEYLGDCRPAATFVVVTSLADARFLIEIEAIAVLPDEAR